MVCLYVFEFLTFFFQYCNLAVAISLHWSLASKNLNNIGCKRQEFSYRSFWQCRPRARAVVDVHSLACLDLLPFLIAFPTFFTFYFIFFIIFFICFHFYIFGFSVFNVTVLGARNLLRHFLIGAYRPGWRQRSLAWSRAGSRENSDIVEKWKG